ncbi:hypothetical protein TNCV_2640571 [Trichonephila clavipes]|nr:hypothetical protein TNCV_2640571 [Trichonephila clavipes]
MIANSARTTFAKMELPTLRVILKVGDSCDSYHSSCYKTFTALKKKIFLADANKEIPLQSTSSSAIEQPSTSANSSIIDDTMVQDSILNDVNIPKTDEVVEKKY